ncbi:amidohydrolase family protein [Candidatus Daviesbacteria bacterium]|nr:amidohydrolase family protein [Candidatus Daviesbacteria bacterium]
MSNLIKLPGLIDPHVHLREPGATQKEDFITGTKAAIAGGYTTVLDMPNNPIPTVTQQALEEKIKLATGKVYSDIGFHFGASRESIQYFKQVEDKVFGLKLYMNHTTGELLIEDATVLEEIFSEWTKGKPILVHAEADTLAKAISLAKKYGNKLHVCHVSLKAEIDMIRAAKSEGLDITCEVTCHHLFLTEEDQQRLGPFGIMRPPLSSKEDQSALWYGIEEGVVDMIGSDHAPHTKDEKLSEKVPNGVPGLETTLPLLLTAVDDGRLTLDKLIELTYTNPKRVFNIPDQQDTFVEVDLDEPYTINNKLYTKCGWTPFAGMEATGRIKKVVLRGQLVFDGQNIFGPYGQVMV